MTVEQIASTHYSGYADKAAESNARAKALDTASKTAEETADQGANDRFKTIAEPIEKLLKSVGVELKFNIHEDTGEVQAEVRDADGEKVIRKIPPDEQLDLAASIKKLSTVFLNRTL